MAACEADVGLVGRCGAPRPVAATLSTSFAVMPLPDLRHEREAGRVDLYVSAELGDPLFPGMLRARATEAHEWEFTLCQDDFHYFTLQSKANGLFVAVEHGYEGRYQDMLRARTKPGYVGNWEKFLREDWGDVESFKSDRKLYVSAEFGYLGNEYGMLRARASYRGPWECYEHYYAR